MYFRQAVKKMKYCDGIRREFWKDKDFCFSYDSLNNILFLVPHNDLFADDWIIIHGKFL